MGAFEHCGHPIRRSLRLREMNAVLVQLQQKRLFAWVEGVKEMSLEDNLR